MGRSDEEILSKKGRSCLNDCSLCNMALLNILILFPLHPISNPPVHSDSSHFLPSLAEISLNYQCLPWMADASTWASLPLFHTAFRLTFQSTNLIMFFPGLNLFNGFLTKKKKKKITWLHQVFVVARGVFNLHCGMQTLSCGTWESSSLTRELEPRPLRWECSLSPLDCQGSPSMDSYYGKTPNPSSLPPS